MKFKKYKRKPTYIDMAKVTYKQAKEVLKNGLNDKKVSFSQEDKEKILNTQSNKVAGFVAFDGESYWFVNYEYAKKNYEIED
jgi:hypothetical protein